MSKNKFLDVVFISILTLIFALSCMNIYHPDVSAASTMPSSGAADLKVVDISQYNDIVTRGTDDIDFSALKTQVDAVYIRSFSHSNSTLSIDQQAVNFAASAERVDLDYGFYYYYIPTADLADAKSQAQTFYNFIKKFDFNCIPALDVENNDNKLTKNQLAAAVKTFTDEFTLLSGIDVMIYTYPYFMKENFDTLFNWSQYMLWIAHYDVSAPMENISLTWMPDNLWCWSSWDMWQYTSKGELSSIPASSGGYLDLSHATKNILISPITYQSHVQDIGWQNWSDNGEVSGTSGESKRLEAIRIKLQITDGGIEYQTHVQDIGWMNYVSNGTLSGTNGQSKRMEAIRIRLTGTAAERYDVYYRVHAQNIGWMGWAKNGESAGTAGYSYRLEAIEIQLVAKGGTVPGVTTTSFLDYAEQPKVEYQTHVQNIGWQGYVSNGDIAGTNGQSKRLEAIYLKIENVDGGIEYRTHVQDIGWIDWVAGGNLSGTTGQSKRLEAIQIRLTGAAAEQYDIYYRVHVQNIGWMDWAKNGEQAGTAGLSYRMEAIQVVLIPKGGTAPGATATAFVTA